MHVGTGRAVCSDHPSDFHAGAVLTRQGGRPGAPALRTGAALLQRGLLAPVGPGEPWPVLCAPPMAGPPLVGPDPPRAHSRVLVRTAVERGASEAGRPGSAPVPPSSVEGARASRCAGGAAAIVSNLRLPCRPGHGSSARCSLALSIASRQGGCAPEPRPPVFGVQPAAARSTVLEVSCACVGVRPSAGASAGPALMSLAASHWLLFLEKWARNRRVPSTHAHDCNVMPWGDRTGTRRCLDKHWSKEQVGREADGWRMPAGLPLVLALPLVKHFTSLECNLYIF